MRTNGLAWKVPGGTGYLNVPDLAVVAPSFTRVGDLHLDPPPLLVVEIGSPSTRGVDRGRKLDDYRLGGAGLYVLVDLPAGAPGAEAIFEAHDVAAERVATTTGAIALVVGGRPLQFDLR
ncbi:MAG: putative restriction endonuclease [Actinomycetota bacterium]|nr:putative restriction endonuclease [Actinomycetota bacterium]